jgi:hypothetical protein
MSFGDAVWSQYQATSAVFDNAFNSIPFVNDWNDFVWSPFELNPINAVAWANGARIAGLVDGIGPLGEANRLLQNWKNAPFKLFRRLTANPSLLRVAKGVGAVALVKGAFEGGLLLGSAVSTMLNSRNGCDGR